MEDGQCGCDGWRGMLGNGTGESRFLFPPRHALAGMLGPAFVAAVAYVDPGNVAANITSGARYGYLLVWVLVLANCMSVLIQYQSAKLGIVTGKKSSRNPGRTTWRRRSIHVFHASGSHCNSD